MVDIVRTIRDSSSSFHNSKSPWDSPDRLRIITFYQGQVECIKKLLYRHGLGRVLVATVDSSQGCEADIVIVSFVRSNSRQGNAQYTTGFLTDDRRMNVALTRAKYQLVCIGNAYDTLQTSGDKLLKAIVDDVKMRGIIHKAGCQVRKEQTVDAIKLSVTKQNPEEMAETLLQIKIRKIARLKQTLPFVTNNLMERKNIMLEIASIQNEILTLRRNKLSLIKAS